jgi:hypothetical protein
LHLHPWPLPPHPLLWAFFLALCIFAHHSGPKDSHSWVVNLCGVDSVYSINDIGNISPTASSTASVFPAAMAINHPWPCPHPLLPTRPQVLAS